MTLVMVVDDEPDILESTDMVLRANGFGVLTVGHASLILPALRRSRPDIVMQDVNMPGLDLDFLMKDIRGDARLKDVRVVLFTASEHAEEIMHRIGADGLIRKPFDAFRLKQTLDQTLAKPALPAVKP